jgi:hypothetical protein
MLTLALVGALPGRDAASHFAIDRHLGAMPHVDMPARSGTRRDAVAAPVSVDMHVAGSDRRHPWALPIGKSGALTRSSSDGAVQPGSSGRSLAEAAGCAAKCPFTADADVEIGAPGWRCQLGFRSVARSIRARPTDLARRSVGDRRRPSSPGTTSTAGSRPAGRARLGGSERVDRHRAPRSACPRCVARVRAWRRR